MTPAPINLAHKLGLFAEPWSPRVVAEMNAGLPAGIQFKLVKLQGEFVWHAHEQTDETFLVLSGEMRMRFRDRDERVRAGEMIVVPRGVEHCPQADSECHVLIVEPHGVVNTGDADSALRAPDDVWI